MKNNLQLLIIVSFSLFLLNSCSKTEQKEAKIAGSYQAMQLMTHSRAYPNPDITSGGFGKAFEYDQNQFKNNASNRVPVDPWEPKGPINTAGRCLALAINPQADQTIYLGSASGGLWRSRSLGDGISWEYMATGHGVLGVSSIAFANEDSLAMYIGTGEVYNNEITGNDGAYRATRGSYGVGILKSTDGGTSWTKSLDWTYQNQKGVQAIKVDQDNSATVFAATTDGVYRSTNAGADWVLVLDVPMATDLEINGMNVIAACGNLGSSNRGIYNSNDGGSTWIKNSDSDIPETFQGKILLASAQSNLDVVYASVGNGFSGPDGATWLLRSDDGGLNWDLQNQEDYSKWQGWFAHDITVDPQDENIISAVGIDIYGSTDGGITLTQKSNGGVTLGLPPAAGPDGDPLYSHSDHHVTMFHPNIPNLILYGNDGGLFKSDDGGNTFGSANGGLQTTQYYNGFAVSHQNPEFALGGLQDNSTSIHRGNGLWQRAIGGDGSWSGINFDNDNIVYGSWQNLNIRRSSDNGQNFNENVGINKMGVPIFIAPYQISEINPQTIYAAGSFVYKTTNGGDSWTTTNGNNWLNGDPIYSLAISPLNDNIVYAATAPFGNGAAQFTTFDGGNTWIQFGFGLPERFVNDLYSSVHAEGRVFAVMSGFGTGHVYVSEDFGENWTDISADLPDVPTNAILEDPENEGHLYLGNDLGVYFSEDGGVSWEDFTDGLNETLIAMDLEYSPLDRKIWVATHGKGVFRRDLVGDESSTEDDAAWNVNVGDLYPNPAISNSMINFDIHSASSQNLRISFFNSTGQLVQKSTHVLNAGNNTISSELNNFASGAYHVLVEDQQNRKISKTLVIQ